MKFFNNKKNKDNNKEKENEENEINDKILPHQKNKKISYLKKMIIDVNNNNFNLNERNSFSPNSNIIQNQNTINSNNINSYSIKGNPLFTSWNNNKIIQEKEKDKEKSQISKILSSSQNHKFDIYLPEINKNINNINSNNKSSSNQNNNNNNINIRSLKNLLKKNTLNNNNINSNLDNQSITNESKKISSRNNTEELSKERIDLMSKKFLSNLNINSASSNIIIPMIPLRRPNSNFNLGENILWEKIENLNSKILNTDEIINKSNINNLNSFNSRNDNSNSLERGKISTAPLINNTVKLHKIKIEKGMMSTKLADTINKKMYNFELNEYYLNNLYNKSNKNSYRQIISNRKPPLKISKVNNIN